MITQERLDENKQIMKTFLDLRPIQKQYKLPYGEVPFGYIYCIENQINGKKYIGATYARQVGQTPSSLQVQLNKRARDYLYDYHRAKDGTATLYMTRPIINAMVNDGINNFRMYPLAETTKSTHSEAEKYFINKFNTVSNGYNVQYGGAGVYKVGTPISAAGKLSRSDAVFCINESEKKIIFSDSMKLFADFVNSSKDMIKNSNRKGRPYKGWMIFYIDPEKRSYILTKYVLGDGLAITDRHSDKSKSKYTELYRAVDLYLRTPPIQRMEYFSGYEILDRLEYRNK